MHWAGINGGCETFRARGDHTFARPLGTRCVPLGAEGAGVVVAVGEGVTRTRVGQAVAVNASAAFSEYCTARERLLTPLPGPAADRPPGPEAAVLALSGMTAICALEGIAKMREGDVVVVTAAAGGTGHIAVQLALLAGCHVVAVVGSPAKASALQQLRQHTCSLQIVDRSAAGSGRVDDAVLGLHPGGAHVVFEGVGGLLRAQLLRCLAPGGRFLQIGYISEYPHASPSGPEWQAEQAPHAAGSHAASEWDAAIPTLPSAAELFWGQQDVLGLPGGRSVHGRVWPQDARTLLRCKSRLYRLHYGQGLLDVWSDTSHGLAGLDAVPDAINYMLQGGHVGKVVLNLTPGS